MTGMACMVVLDREESVESWLVPVVRLLLEFECAGSCLLGEDLPPGTEDERGGRSGPSVMYSAVSCRGAALVLAARDCACSSGASAVIPTLPCRGLLPLLPFMLPSRPLRCRSLCCFFLRP
jgi:hypothetical protein